MRRIRRLLALVACLPLVACVTSPSSRTGAESSASVSLEGFVLAPSQTITLQVVDQNTGALVPLNTGAPIKSNPTSTGIPFPNYTLYYWSSGILPLASNYWTPQSSVADLKSSQGHLEIVATAGGKPELTFSAAAYAAFNAKMAAGTDPLVAAAQTSDGTSTVLLDTTGVGSGQGSAWSNVQGMVTYAFAAAPVAWSVGSYTVDGGKKIYGLVCSPTTGGPYPVVIYNHGGTDSSNGGGITGIITKPGGTSAPPFPTPDGLGQCIDWAKRGWVFATSAYRGESVAISSASPAFPAPAVPWTSDGAPELCLGEVTDVMALTRLVLDTTSPIKVGGPSSAGGAGQMVALKVDAGRVLMVGYSHGGCVTYRAVEQGAPVKAFAVTEGFTDFRLQYVNVFNTGTPLHSSANAALNSGAGIPTAGNPASGYYYPVAAGVMGYNWRSPRYFASRGDLSIQTFKTMPMLIFHGDVDIPAAGPPNPVYLDEPVALAQDLGATIVYVAPAGMAFPAQASLPGPVGAPFADAGNPPTPTFTTPAVTPLDTGDPCLTPDAFGALGLCATLPLPLTPPAGQAQQLRYLVVYHNMDHVNGGLAIKQTFNRFVEQNFTTKPGCDGLTADCATD